MKSTRKVSPGRAPKIGPLGAGALTNLETDGDKVKVYSLSNLLRHKQTHRNHRKATTLGEVLAPLFQREVEKPAQKLGPCVDVWLAHVPAKLAAATRLVGFHRGTLTVAAESAIVRAELDAALRKGLLNTLQTSSKGTIYRVKTAVSAHEIPEIS